MNKFKVFREYSLYELETEVNRFLRENYRIKVISHSIEVSEKDTYICTIIYKIQEYYVLEKYEY